MNLPTVHPLSFRQRFGSRYAPILDTDFFLSYDPWGENFMAPGPVKPPVNVKRGEAEYVMHIALPGYHREDFSVALENGVLCVKGEHTEDASGPADYILHEYVTERFERSFRLGPVTDQERITAAFRNGMLYIHLPHRQKEPVQPGKNKSIPVE